MNKIADFELWLKPPSVNAYWKKTRSGGRMVSEEARQFKKDFIYSVRERGVTGKPSKKRIELHLDLYFKDKRKKDIDNYCKGILDSMSGLIFEDDEQIDKLIINKIIGYGRDKIGIVAYEKE